MKVSDKQIEKAMRAAGGFQSVAAKKLGICQSAVSQRIKKSEKLQKAVEEIRYQVLDLAESQLLSAVKDREAWAICFLLKCKGKERGYVEKQIIQAETEKPIEIIIRDAE